MPATDYTRITVYCTDDEKRLLKALADKAGLSISSYLKKLALGDKQETTPQVASSKTD